MLPANEIGERVAFYYTLAWLDEYLRHGRDALLPAGDTAFHRLTTLGGYDQSADHNDNQRYRGAADISFGAGTYNEAAAAADPTNRAAGNVPYEIQGIPIRDTLSFYYYSEYHLHDPVPGARHSGRATTCWPDARPSSRPHPDLGRGPIA